MITVKRLKNLLSQLDERYRLYAYEGKHIGIVIVDEENIETAFIQATDEDVDDNYIEGFYWLRAWDCDARITKKENCACVRNKQ